MVLTKEDLIQQQIKSCEANMARLMREGKFGNKQYINLRATLEALQVKKYQYGCATI
jgi:hypothetical protein